MTSNILGDAFGHHVWASIRLLDACADLDQDQLGTSVPGTYGSIIQTLRDVMDAHDLAWQRLIAGDLDPSTDVVGYEANGYETHAPLGIRLAQALYHGTDHRSQVCTALTSLGIEPPAIEAWDLAREDGRMFTVESAGAR